MSDPEIGKPLPRGSEAWVEDAKWHGYVLAHDGHGQDWQRVFQVEAGQSAELWTELAELATSAPITEIRFNPHGVGCELQVELTFNHRTAPVILAFFYNQPGNAPRLVTAYPVP